MHSLSTSLPGPSMASDLPADVLYEIFLQSLPECPLDEVQPNTKIAPLQLCHVSSSWRAVALSNSSLWLHLHYNLPIRWEKGQPIAWNAQKFLRDVECLKWWRKNQGSRPPSIRLSVSRKPRGTNYEELALTEDDIRKYFIEYLSSARHLDVDRFGQYLLQLDASKSDSQIALLNLHSLVTTHFREKNMFALPLEQLKIPSTLRQLSLHSVELQEGFAKNLASWTSLTHLSLKRMSLDPQIWYSLIRSVPALRWGSFEFYLDSEIELYDPPECTLSYLSALSLTIDSPEFSPDPAPLDEILVNLNFPVLHELSLYIANPDKYSVSSAADEFNQGLKSAPAITKLTVGVYFKCFPELEEPEEEDSPTQSLSNLIPGLTHLVIDLADRQGCPLDGETEFKASYWARLLPGYACWVDLQNPASAIQKITFVVSGASTRGQLVEPIFRDAMGTQAGAIVELEIVKPKKKDFSPEGEGWRMWDSCVY